MTYYGAVCNNIYSSKSVFANPLKPVLPANNWPYHWFLYFTLHYINHTTLDQESPPCRTSYSKLNNRRLTIAWLLRERIACFYFICIPESRRTSI